MGKKSKKANKKNRSKSPTQKGETKEARGTTRAAHAAKQGASAQAPRRSRSGRPGEAAQAPGAAAALPEPPSAPTSPVPVLPSSAPVPAASAAPAPPPDIPTLAPPEADSKVASTKAADTVSEELDVGQYEQNQKESVAASQVEPVVAPVVDPAPEPKLEVATLEVVATPESEPEETAPVPNPSPLPTKEEVTAEGPRPAKEEAPTPAPAPAPRKIAIMSNARVTLEHLEIIYKYGGDTVDKKTAVTDMHSELKSSDGGLGELKSSQYAFTVNPLKEAIWFERKGQFAIGCEPDWTLCKVFMTTQKSVSALTNNLGLADLQDLPGDDSVTSLKKIGNKLTDKEANDWFSTTLEALYDLVEMDSTGAINCERRDDLFQLVASFVRNGSRTCFQSGTPAPKITGLPEPPRFGFAVIMKVFAKLKELGGKDLDSVDWESMKIPKDDGEQIWKSLSERSKQDLPGSVWWKVLFLLVLEFEPHLLRMNLHLLDKESVTSFQTFLDECMEPPDLANNRFYKRLIQQVLSLQKICLLTTPPRRNMSPLSQLDKAFESGANAVYKPELEAALSPAEAPVPDASEPEATAAKALPTGAPVEPPAAAPAPPPLVVAAPAPPPAVAAPAPAPEPEPATTPAPPPVDPAVATPSNEPPPLPSLTAAGVQTASPVPKADVAKAPAPAPKQRPAGKPPRSPRGPPIDIPIEIKTDLPAIRAPSDNYSVTGSLAELHNEDGLMGLMQQAAAMCESITTQKRELITKERRAARNLKSAEENLKAVQVINAQLRAENISQKEEIYQREDDINQLHVEAKQAANELSVLDTQNSQLLEQIEELTRTISGLTADKTGLEQSLQQSKEEAATTQAALDVANQEKAALEAQIAAEQEAKAIVEQDLTQMQQEKDTVELKLKDLQALLESANDEIDRLEEVQAEQQRLEAEARKAAMEARRREFERAEREAEESLRKAEEVRKARSTARRTRMAG